MVKSKKILFVITQADFGGAQRYVFDLINSLHLQGYDVSVAAGPEGQELFDRLEKLYSSSVVEKTLSEKPYSSSAVEKQSSTHAPIQIHRLKYLKRSINPYYDLLALLELKRLFATEKPDVVHLNSTKAGILGSIAVKLSAKSYQLKAIYTVHGWVFNEPLPNWLKNFYLFCERWTARYKHKIVCVSDYDRQVAIKNKVAPPEKLVTIHNGIDYEKLDFLSKEEALEKLKITLPTDKKIIGTIANFYLTKGLKYLIEATNQIKEPALFVIIGSGPEELNLKLKAKSYNLEAKIIFLGHLPDAYKYLKAFDLFVLPSVKEGFPYVLLEAMAAELPIVATRVGGVPEIIANNINGFLVTPGDPLALATKINHLLENKKIADNFAQRNAEKIKGFGLSQMVEKTRQAYEA